MSNELVNFKTGDIVRVNYGHDIPEGFYEVNFTKEDDKTIMWLHNDRDGSYNTMYHSFGRLVLVASANDRLDKK